MFLSSSLEGCDVEGMVISLPSSPGDVMLERG